MKYLDIWPAKLKYVGIPCYSAIRWLNMKEMEASAAPITITHQEKDTYHYHKNQ